MKILFVIDSLGTGGAQRQIVNLSVGLKKLNHEVFLLTYNKSNFFEETLKENNITHLLFKKKSRFDISIILKIIKLQKKEKFDFICAFLFTPSFYILSAKFLMPQVKIIVSERTFEDLVPNFHKIITRYLYRNADAIVTNSYHQGEILNKKYKLFRDKIFTISNGVNLSLFTQKDNVGKNEKSLSIVCIGRVSSLKNTKLVIEAANKLVNDEKLKITFNWIGAKYEWVEHQSEYYNECNKLVIKYTLENNWFWLGQTKNVADYLSKSDVLVHASLGEGFPNVICEALACGIPVIASNVYDHPLIIKEGENGFLFNPDKPESLVEKIKILHSLPISKKKAIGTKARKTAEVKFSNDVLAKAYEQLFKHLMFKE